MSTFFVARTTIDATVDAFIADGGPLSLETATRLGRPLWALNAEAVRWRYDLDIGTPEERAEHASHLAAVAAYAWNPRDLSVAVMVKAVDCLNYQCCEDPVLETALYGRLTMLANHHDASGLRDTEAYKRAPWGLDEEDRFIEEARSASSATTAASVATPFRSELMPEGEQLVIPGCERKRSKVLRQLDLFG